MTLTIFLFVFLAVVFVLVTRMRGQFALEGAEGVAIFAYAFLALLQGVFQHQVSFDDYLFTPFYLAIPIWLGSTRGPSHGVVGTALGLCALAVVAAVHPLQGRAGGELGDLLFQEWLLALLVLTAIAGGAGIWKAKAVACGLLPLAWVAFLLTIQPALLTSMAPWIMLAISVFVTTAGFAVLQAAGPAGSVREPSTQNIG